RRPEYRPARPRHRLTVGTAHRRSRQGDPRRARRGVMTVRAHPTRLGPLPLVVAFVAALLAIVFAVAFGPGGVSPIDVVAVLVDKIPGVDIDGGVAPTIAASITEVRRPRVLLASLVGAVLACAGGAYQATFHNPLADP